MTVVEKAARAWWRAHRPIGWTVVDHLRQPIVNALTPREIRLAMAVASLIRMERQAGKIHGASRAETPKERSIVRSTGLRRSETWHHRFWSLSAPPVRTAWPR
jgi:hypothetical protein